MEKEDVFVLEDAYFLNEEGITYIRRKCRDRGVFLLIISRGVFDFLSDVPSITISGISDYELISLLEKAHGAPLPPDLLRQAIDVTKNHPVAATLLAKLISERGLEKA